MIRRNPSGHIPVIDPTAFIDPTAILCGKIVIGPEVFIGPCAVIRADEVDQDGEMEPIIIGACSNVQDGVVIHSKAGAAVTIGERVSIAHRSIVHGPCAIGDDVFVGFNSVLFNCQVGDGAVIRHNSVVEACRLPERFHVPSTTAIRGPDDLAKIPQVTPDVTSFSESVVSANAWLVRGYRAMRNEF
jgi:carbonic anhydrase/acetyltransferase-like protein (isoleucine patch superfamily)